jgi:hypothetical protein
MPSTSKLNLNNESIVTPSDDIFTESQTFARLQMSNIDLNHTIANRDRLLRQSVLSEEQDDTPVFRNRRLSICSNLNISDFSAQSNNKSGDSVSGSNN